MYMLSIIKLHCLGMVPLFLFVVTWTCIMLVMDTFGALNALNATMHYMVNVLKCV